jgi:hypothetical protein
MSCEVYVERDFGGNALAIIDHANIDLIAARGHRAARRGRKQQVRTAVSYATSIMRHPHFARGLDDIHAGQRFADHVADEYCAYERGRLFGAIAPRSMPLFIGGRINPKAVRLFETAADRKLIP